jgi:hypothetical protein
MKGLDLASPMPTDAPPKRWFAKMARMAVRKMGL